MSQPQRTVSSQACPECREPLGTTPLELHLFVKHRIYQFRGQRIPPQELFPRLIRAVCTPPSDAEAWCTLHGAAQDQYGTRADRFLANGLTAALGKLDENSLRTSLRATAWAITAGPDASGLLTLLASENDPAARQLALALTGRWRTGLPLSLHPLIRPLLGQREGSTTLQLEATANLLRALPTGDPAEGETLRALIARMGKAAGLRRLRRLRKLLGGRPALMSLIEELAAQVRMRCPRCQMELRRPEMIDHLWREHNLVLDGEAVRDPWVVIQERLADRKLASDPATLESLRGLAQQLDPEQGSLRVYRLALRSGARHPEAQRNLLDEAERRQSSLCPGCFAFVPVPHPVPPPPLNRWRGRLSARGYRIELTESGLLTSLELVTPTQSLYRGQEPNRRLTRTGALYLWVGPWIACALALSVFLSGEMVGGPLVPVLVVLSVALILAIYTGWRWRPRGSVLDRAVDYAWMQLVPHLHAGGFSRTDAEFLARLSLLSAGQGHPGLRRAALLSMIQRTESETQNDPLLSPTLAGLRRLLIHDAVTEGQDPVPLVVAELIDCLEGRLPLVYGEALLNDWQTDWWTTGNRARLRVLLCDRAFKAGFEVSHLLEIGQTYAALGQTLAISQTQELALLRLLWSMGASRPWNRAGVANTVFELAPTIQAAHLLTEHADVLLVHEDRAHAVLPAGGDEISPLRILVCAQSVWVQDRVFAKRPMVIEVKSRRSADGATAYELRVGDERFLFAHDPSDVAIRLDRFFRFLFNEFLPQVSSALTWRSPDVGARLRARGALPCPECKRSLLPRLGHVATTLSD